MKTIVKWVGLIACPVLGAGFLMALLGYVRKDLLGDPRPLAPFVVGMGLWFWLY